MLSGTACLCSYIAMAAWTVWVCGIDTTNSHLVSCLSTTFLLYFFVRFEVYSCALVISLHGFDMTFLWHLGRHCRKSSIHFVLALVHTTCIGGLCSTFGGHLLRFWGQGFGIFADLTTWPISWGSVEMSILALRNSILDSRSLRMRCKFFLCLCPSCFSNAFRALSRFFHFWSTVLACRYVEYEYGVKRYVKYFRDFARWESVSFIDDIQLHIRLFCPWGEGRGC